MTAIEPERQPQVEHARASDPPTGLVTFLFTDIEGSTKLWEKHPGQMRHALARHDAILRTAIASNGGFVFKTIGDAFCATFPSAVEGLIAALAAQRALADEPWGDTGPLRARMALHTGEAEFRDNDYFGPPVNRVARLLAVGHGGQILLSAVTQEHLLDELPEGVALRDLGKHRLKDLGQREPIAQCLAPGLPVVFPKLRTPPSPVPGAVAAVGAAFLGLNVFAVAGGGADLGPSLLSPATMRTSLTGMVVALSTQRETILLLLAGILLLATLVVIGLWWRAGRVRRGTLGHAARLAGRHVGLRTATFFVVATLAVLGAYGYQQYLWQVKLPIPDDVTGLALTRPAAAASLREELAFAIQTEGPGREVVVRELPVNFDAGDVDEARRLGRRIGAEAVVIYRDDASEAASPGRFVAYVVFTDPNLGWVVGEAGPAPDAEPAADPSPLSMDQRPGVAVPTLRAASSAAVFTDLVTAAAGIVAYQDSRYASAIAHLKAVELDADSPNQGIVNYYLCAAYRFAGQNDEAATACERAIAFYEQKRAQTGLGTQDELILVETYTERGFLARQADDFAGAIGWYEQGLEFREDLLARAGGLEKPNDVHAAYADLYGRLADASRLAGRTEEARQWRLRTQDEVAALAAASDPDDADAFLQQALPRFSAGDCVGATTALDQALALEPDNVDALMDAGIVWYFRDRPDLARSYWERIASIRLDIINARKLIASVLVAQALGGEEQRFFDPAYLDAAEAELREVIRLDPADVEAHESLAELAGWRAEGAESDIGALSAADDLTYAKSQVAWAGDLARRQAALDAWAVAIGERLILATELRPDDPDALVALADVYFQRLSVIYDSLIALYGDPFDPAVWDPANPQMQADGEQILADAAQARAWTDRVLAYPEASRLTKLLAWSARVQAIEHEWAWYIFFAQDTAKAKALEADFRTAVGDAVAFVEAEPIAETYGITPAVLIYSEARFIALALDEDEAAAAVYDEKSQGLWSGFLADSEAENQALAAVCAEEQERAAGEEALIGGDDQAAREHFEAAIAISPNDVGALTGLAGVLAASGDYVGATEPATAATQAWPDNPRLWAKLGLYQLAAGQDASAAYNRFLELASARPAHERMADLGEAVHDLHDLVGHAPDQAPRLREVLPRFTTYLDGMAAAGAGTFHYPALYASVGALFLDVDDPAGAELLLRTAIAIDPHQPAAHADLVLAVLAQERDATAEIDAAMQETANPLWPGTYEFGPDVLLSLMDREVEDYVARFPDRAAKVDVLTQAIAAERERQAIP